MKSAKSFFFIDHKNPDGLDEIRSQKVGENTRALYHSRNKEMHSIQSANFIALVKSVQKNVIYEVQQCSLYTKPA